MTSPVMLYGHSLIEWYAKRYTRFNMRAVVTILRIDDPLQDFEDSEKATSKVNQILYHGPARLYQVSGGTQVSSMEDESVVSTSYISTPMIDEATGDPVMSQFNDVIQIDEHSDPLVIGLVFRILDVDAGGQWPAVRRHMVSGAMRSMTWQWGETVPGPSDG